MAVRPYSTWTRRLGTLTLWGAAWGTGFGGASLWAGEPRAMPAVPSSIAAFERDFEESLAATAVPLPPRDLNAKPRLPRHESTSDTVTQAVIDVVITSPVGAVSAVPVDPLGWKAAGSRSTAAGSARIDALAPAVATADLSQTLPVAANDTGRDVPIIAAWTVVESTDPTNPTPLLDGGVMRSDAVFDGIPVVTGDLAPLPICEQDDSRLKSLAQFYALAPMPLDGRPALVAPTTEPVANPDFTNLTPVDTAVDTTGPAAAPGTAPAEIDAESRDRISGALAQLQKPLAGIVLTTGLFEREPPDLAAVAEPAGQPEVVWGAPWPDVKLAQYRYTVPQYHRPLYFEQPNFERCGESWWLFSPYASAANFAGNILLLPVHAVLQPPCSCQQSLGDCPTCHSYPLCPRCPLQ